MLFGVGPLPWLAGLLQPQTTPELTVDLQRRIHHRGDRKRRQIAGEQFAAARILLGIMDRQHGAVTKRIQVGGEQGRREGDIARLGLAAVLMQQSAQQGLARCAQLPQTDAADLQLCRQQRCQLMESGGQADQTKPRRASQLSKQVKRHGDRNVIAGSASWRCHNERPPTSVKRLECNTEQSSRIPSIGECAVGKG